MSDAPWRLGGRFDLLGPLGTGAAGTVWRGREVADGTEHAVKLLRPELVSENDAVTQLYATLNAVAQLGHPGIVAVDDAVVADGWLAIRTRLVPGESLRALLSRQGAMAPARAASLIAQVCDALAAAHAAGIVHGDLSPTNVLLVVAAPGEAALAQNEAVLTDFGMADLVNRAAARNVAAGVAGAGLAAPPTEYRAPELAPTQPVSAQADVYAAGIILYECMAGRPPFVAQSLDAVAQMHLLSTAPPIAGVADSLWRIVAACLEKDPRYRPTAVQLADALRNEASTMSGIAAPGIAAAPGEAMRTQLIPVVPGMSGVPAAPAGAYERASSGNVRLPRVISEHKTESGIAAAVVVVGLLIGVALSMAGGGSNNGSGNIAAAGQATSAPSADAGSSAPDAVVLPSASSPSASPSASPSPSPSMSGPTTGNMTFVNVLTSKCMDTAGRIFANGTTEDIYDCNGTPAQTWTVTADDRLTQDGGAYCLDDLGFGNTPGTKVALWSCNGGSNQQWTLHPDGSVTSNYANLCLDVTGQGSSDFTPLVLENCDGNPSQQWTRQQ